jgi:hypothetical protein
MEGAGNRTSYNNVYDFSDTALESTSYYDSAVATLYTDIMETESEFMAADVIATATIIYESNNGNGNIDKMAIMEGVVGGAIEKIKQAFIKFKEKVKAFFKKVIDYFKVLFASGEKFVKEFGDGLKKKKTKGFVYQGFTYKISDGDAHVEFIRKAADDALSEEMSALDEFSKNLNENTTVDDFNDVIKNKVLNGEFKGDSLPTASEFVDSILSKKCKISDASEVRQSIVDKYRNDETEKHAITEFEVASVDEMLKFIKEKGTKTYISKLEKENKDMEKGITEIIKILDKYKAADESDAEANKVKHASYLSSCLTQTLNVLKSVTNAKIEIYKAVNTEWLGALKKFWRYREVKESIDFYDEDSLALLESEDNLCFESKGGSDDDDDSDDKDDSVEESAVSRILEQAALFSL